MRGFDFTGKAVLITGAGKGIGKGIAIGFAECGADVWLVGRNADDVRSTAEEIAAMGHKSGWSKADVSKKDQLAAAMEAAVESFGKIDVYVNNAGIFNADPFVSCTPETIQEVLAINTLGPTYGCQLALDYMIKAGSGCIVNVASQAGRGGEEFSPYYCMSKAAVLNMTQSAAKVGAHAQIRVNAVCPGTVRTPMWENKILEDLVNLYHCDKEQAWAASCSGIPMGRPQTIDDIANAVLFFSSDLAQNITGQALNVDGGMKMN